MLPILLYPITIPVIIAGVRGTAALLAVDAGRAGGAHVDRAARGVRRRVRDAGAVDVRAVDDGVRNAEAAECAEFIVTRRSQRARRSNVMGELLI